MDPQDLMLEYALRRHFTDDVDPDLAARIAAAWRAGERGSLTEEELEEIGSLVEGPRLVRGELGALAPARSEHSEHIDRPRQAWLQLVAAAVLLVAVVGVWWWTRPGSDPIAPSLPVAPATPAFAQAAAPAQVLRGPSRAALETRELEHGDAVLALTEPVRLSFAGGLSLWARAPSLFVVDGTAEGATVEVFLGDLSLETGAGEARARTDFSSVHVLADTSLSLEVARAPGAEPTPPLDVALARTLLVSGLRDARTLRVRVTSGEAVLTRGQSEVPLDPTSGSLVVPSRRAPVLTPEEEERYEELVATLLELDEPGPPLRFPGVSERMAELAELLAQAPALSADFRERVEPGVLAEAPEPLFLSYTLDVLAACDDAVASDLADELWSVHPAAFQPSHLHAFAERGMEDFERELAALVAYLLEEPDQGELPTGATAHVALAGDPAARAFFVPLASTEVVRQTGYGWPDGDFLLANLVADRTDTPGAFREAVEFVAMLVREQLALGETKEVDRLLALLDSYTQAARDDPLRLTRLPRLEAGARSAAEQLEPGTESREAWLVRLLER